MVVRIWTQAYLQHTTTYFWQRLYGAYGCTGNGSGQGSPGLLVPIGRYRLGAELFTSIFIMSTSLLFLLSDGKLQMKNYLKLPRIHSEKKNHYQNNLEKTGLK